MGDESNGKLSAEDIKNRFKGKDKSNVASIIDEARKKEEIYSEEGSQRAEQAILEKSKEEQDNKNYFTTTLRIPISAVKRFKTLEIRLLNENSKLTYEKVFLAGLELLENKNDTELNDYIKKISK